MALNRLALRDEAGTSAVGMAKGGADDQYATGTAGHAGDSRALFGMIGAGVAEVVAEEPGRPPARLELLPIPGWQFRAFLLWPGGDRSDVVLVFRDGSGAEIGRSE